MGLLYTVDVKNLSADETRSAERYKHYTSAEE